MNTSATTLFLTSLLALFSATLATDYQGDEQELSLTDFGVDGRDGRLFTTGSFNASALLVAIALGAGFLLLLGIGFYLFNQNNDYHRKEYITTDNDYASYSQSQYQNAQYAYPATQSYQNYAR